MIHMSKHLVILITLLLVSCTNKVITIESEPERYAWWLRLNVEPRDTVIQGIPIVKIDPDWSVAYLFKKEDIPNKHLNEYENDVMSANNVAFNLNGDFNNDGKQDHAFVGVFKAKDNTKGTFLLILTKTDSNKWKISFIDTFIGGGDFIVIDKRSSNGVNVWFCMYCNHGAKFKWIKEKQIYEFQKPENDDI